MLDGSEAKGGSVPEKPSYADTLMCMEPKFAKPLHMIKGDCVCWSGRKECIRIGNLPTATAAAAELGTRGTPPSTHHQHPQSQLLRYIERRRQAFVTGVREHLLERIRRYMEVTPEVYNVVPRSRTSDETLRLTDHTPVGKCVSKMWNWARLETDLPRAMTAADVLQEVFADRKGVQQRDALYGAESAGSARDATFDVERDVFEVSTELAYQVEKCHRSFGKSHVVEVHAFANKTFDLGSHPLENAKFLLCVPLSCGEAALLEVAGLEMIFAALQLRYLTSYAGVKDSEQHKPHRSPVKMYMSNAHSKEFFLPVAVLESEDPRAYADLAYELRRRFYVRPAEALVSVSSEAGDTRVISETSHVERNVKGRFCVWKNSFVAEKRFLFDFEEGHEVGEAEAAGEEGSRDEASGSSGKSDGWSYNSAAALHHANARTTRGFAGENLPPEAQLIIMPAGAGEGKVQFGLAALFASTEPGEARDNLHPRIEAGAALKIDERGVHATGSSTQKNEGGLTPYSEGNQQKLLRIRNATDWKLDMPPQCAGFHAPSGWNCLREEADLNLQYWEDHAAEIQHHLAGGTPTKTSAATTDDVPEPDTDTDAAEKLSSSEATGTVFSDVRRKLARRSTRSEKQKAAFAIIHVADLVGRPYDKRWTKKRSRHRIFPKAAATDGFLRRHDLADEDTLIDSFSDVDFWKANKAALDYMDAAARRLLGSGVDRVLAIPESVPTGGTTGGKISAETIDLLQSRYNVVVRKEWNLKKDILAHLHDSHFWVNFLSNSTAYAVNMVCDQFKVLVLLTLGQEYAGGVMALDSDYTIVQPFRVLQFLIWLGMQENFATMTPEGPLHVSMIAMSHVTWRADRAVQEAWRKIVVRIFESKTGKELLPPGYRKFLRENEGISDKPLPELASWASLVVAEPGSDAQAAESSRAVPAAFGEEISAKGTQTQRAFFATPWTHLTALQTLRGDRWRAYQMELVKDSGDEFFVRLGDTPHLVPRTHIGPVGGNNIYGARTSLGQGLSGYILSVVLPNWWDRRTKLAEWSGEEEEEDGDMMSNGRGIFGSFTLRNLPMCRWSYMVQMEHNVFYCDGDLGPPVLVHKPDQGLALYMRKWARLQQCAEESS
eukprot:g17144.t1